MNKLSFKKLLLGSLLTLQLASEVAISESSTAYAKENTEKEILLDENEKKLHMIGFKINNYEYITLGYLYPKDHCVYIKDARKETIYNLTNIYEDANGPEITYTEMENVLPKEFKNKKSLTEKEANFIVDASHIVNKTIKLPDIENVYSDFTYQTFSTPNFGNLDFDTSGCSQFDNADDVFHSFTVSDDYNEDNEIINLEVNNYKLGFYENKKEYSCYSNIYQDKGFKKSDAMGIITGYYVFNKRGEKVTTLKTQEEIDKFIERKASSLEQYTWKVSFCSSQNVGEVLARIESNKPVSYTNTTYFIDYKPDQKKLIKK